MNLRKLTLPDVAVVVSGLLLVLAALTPLLGARAFRALADEATTEVEALRAAALDVRSTTGRWPASSPPGEVPPSLSLPYSGRGGIAFDDFTLEWRSLDVIEYVPAPPQPAFTLPEGDEEPGATVPPSGTIGDLPPDSVGPAMVPAPRRIGAIVVHTGTESLLAELLSRFGTSVSYVRDTTLTIVIDDRSDPTP